MSEREQAKQIIDCLPECKIRTLLLFLKGMEFDNEMEIKFSGGAEKSGAILDAARKM